MLDTHLLFEFELPVTSHLSRFEGWAALVVEGSGGAFGHEWRDNVAWDGGVDATKVAWRGLHMRKPGVELLCLPGAMRGPAQA